jgi:hypothetical protein
MRHTSATHRFLQGGLRNYQLHHCIGGINGFISLLVCVGHLGRQYNTCIGSYSTQWIQNVREKTHQNGPLGYDCSFLVLLSISKSIRVKEQRIVVFFVVFCLSHHSLDNTPAKPTTKPTKPTPTLSIITERSSITTSRWLTRSYGIISGTWWYTGVVPTIARSSLPAEERVIKGRMHTPATWTKARAHRSAQRIIRTKSCWVKISFSNVVWTSAWKSSWISLRGPVHLMLIFEPGWGKVWWVGAAGSCR